MFQFTPEELRRLLATAGLRAAEFRRCTMREKSRFKILARKCEFAL